MVRGIAVTSQQDAYSTIGYGAHSIGFGERAAVLVIDFMRASTEPGHPFSEKPLVMRALKNTEILLRVARRCNAPVVNCNTTYRDERDMPYWKVSTVIETYREGNRCAEIDPRIHDPAYDLTFAKKGASIFFQTPVISYLTKHRVDTIIITGICTSGCVRAACIDSFQYGFRTIVPEDCVGDFDDGPHRQNLMDVERRYADVCSSADVLRFFDESRKRNI